MDSGFIPFLRALAQSEINQPHLGVVCLPLYKVTTIDKLHMHIHTCAFEYACVYIGVWVDRKRERVRE